MYVVMYTSCQKRPLLEAPTLFQKKKIACSGGIFYLSIFYYGKVQTYTKEKVDRKV